MKWKEVHDDKIAALQSIVTEAAAMPVLVRLGSNRRKSAPGLSSN
jgi:hypothetical protein